MGGDLGGGRLIAVLGWAVLRAERSHQVAAEQVLRDDARIAGTEFIRRSAFDIAFNGYQTLATALLRPKAVHRFDPAGGVWESLPDMPIESTGHRAIAVGPDIYVVGGFRTVNGLRQGFSGVPFVWRYRP